MQYKLLKARVLVLGKRSMDVSLFGVVFMWIVTHFVIRFQDALRLVEECENRDYYSETHHVRGLCHYYKAHFRRAANAFERAFDIDDHEDASKYMQFANNFLSLDNEGILYECIHYESTVFSQKT